MQPQASRRTALAGAAGLLATVLLRPAQAQVVLGGPLEAAVRAWAGSTVPREGRVVFDISPLVENGNAVPITITVDSPMTAADHVAEIAVFNERNPQRDIARYTLGPRSGRAQVSTRIRLATSQKLMALARMNDGSIWSHTVDVVVTLAACVEG